VNKPNGQFLVEDPVKYMETLSVRKVPGIGKVSSSGGGGGMDGLT